MDDSIDALSFCISNDAVDLRQLRINKNREA